MASWIFTNSAIIGIEIFKKKQKSYIGWIRKNPGIHPSIFFAILPKIDNLTVASQFFAKRLFFADSFSYDHRT